LAKTGFDEPRLFIDGKPEQVFPAHLLRYAPVIRYPAIRIVGNWILSAWELYIREPEADRYAIFQDDIVTCLNLREFLERSPFPKDGYLNLSTHPTNEKMGKGWVKSNQCGKGALALVFDNDGLKALLGSPYLVGKVSNTTVAIGATYPGGQTSVDGAIVTAMKLAKRREYIHNPSLVQHTGYVSAMRNRPQPAIRTFSGEEFDALSLFHIPSPCD